MDTSAGRDTARLAVQAELARLGWTPGRLSRETIEPGRSAVDVGTIGDFLSGKRWPKLPTQGRIEKAIGWEPGTITRISQGMEPPHVSGGGEDQGATKEEDAILYQRPAGMSDAQWEEIRRSMSDYLDFQIERASRER